MDALWGDIVGYLETFLIGEVSKDGNLVLQELAKSKEDMLMSLQRYFQTFKSLEEGPTEQEVVVGFLAKLDSSVVDQILQGLEIEEITFETLRVFFRKLGKETAFRHVIEGKSGGCSKVKESEGNGSAGIWTRTVQKKVVSGGGVTKPCSSVKKANRWKKKANIASVYQENNEQPL